MSSMTSASVGAGVAVLVGVVVTVGMTVEVVVGDGDGVVVDVGALVAVGATRIEVAVGAGLGVAVEVSSVVHAMAITNSAVSNVTIRQFIPASEYFIPFASLSRRIFNYSALTKQRFYNPLVCCRFRLPLDSARHVAACYCHHLFDGDEVEVTVEGVGHC